MNNKQPEALELASHIEFLLEDYDEYIDSIAVAAKEASEELRLLHKENAELLEALRLVMACAGEITTAPDSLLEEALNYGDPETRKQAYAFLLCRAAIAKAEVRA